MENFKWHRQSQGGQWFYVRQVVLQGAVFAWKRNPSETETAIKSEAYS